MKKRIATCQVMAAILFMTLAAFTHKEKHNRGTLVNPMLTSHQWTLTQLLQIKNDSVNDLTLLLLPCEKDNYLMFNNDGSYLIQEGQTKCNNDDNTVKGKGTWQYQAEDSTIEERYEGGSKIYKKITTISNDAMVLEYEGEGKKKFRLTYISEQGKQNNVAEKIPATNNDVSWNIRQAIRQYILLTNHFNLIEKNDGPSKITLSEEEKNNPMPKIMMLPFVNKAMPQGNAGNPEENRASIQQAASAGFDYVITGKLLEVRSSNNNNKDFLGTVQFELEILELSDNTAHLKKFNGEKKEAAAPKAQKKNIFLKKILSGVQTISSTLGANAWRYLAFTNYRSYDDLVNVARVVNVADKANTATTLFSNVNEAVRKRYYDSTTAVMTAVNETRDDMMEFLSQHVVNKIKINSIDGSGRKARIKIEAGHNINLKAGEILNVVRCTNTTIAGKTVKEQKLIGKIKIEEITADVVAYCSFEEDGRDIQEAFTKTPAEILVVTTLQTN